MKKEIDAKVLSVVRRDRETETAEEVEYITTLKTDGVQAVFKTGEKMGFIPGQDVKIKLFQPQKKLKSE